MAEYIDREKIREEVCKDCTRRIGKDGCMAPEACEDLLTALVAADPADVATVVHGEWEYDNNATDFGIGGYVCSKCKNRNNNLPLSRVKNVYMFAGSKFCPNCGAKMDGGEKDAEVQA